MAPFDDPHVFRACAFPDGHAEQFPEAGALVYYFPRGHAEQEESEDPDILPEGTKPYFICRVDSVSLLAHPKSDEVFARFRLVPDQEADTDQNAGQDDTGVVSDTKVPDTAQDANPVADTALTTVPAKSGGVTRHTKILKATDVKQYGTLLVPSQCIDQKIFPPLKEGEKQQTISVKDIHGEEYSFEHIYSDKPHKQNHTLYKGWYPFSKKKSLVYGDTLIFIKNRNANDQLVFGLRRTTIKDAEENPQCGFSRRRLGRLKADAIREAVSKAQEGKEFEVDYYPRPEFAEFVVKKDVVDPAINFSWEKGTKVKIRYEGQRIFYYDGEVRLVRSVVSPWRMLQVSKEGKEESKMDVSPWEVKVRIESPRSKTSGTSRGSTNVPVSDITQESSQEKKEVMIFGVNIAGSPEKIIDTNQMKNDHRKNGDGTWHSGQPERTEGISDEEQKNQDKQKNTDQ